MPLPNIFRKSAKINPLSAPVTAETIEKLYEILLKRPVFDDPFIAHLVNRQYPVENLMQDILRSEEYKIKLDSMNRKVDHAVDISSFRVPTELSVTDADIKRVLIVGSCFAHTWCSNMPMLSPYCEPDILLYGVEMPKEPPHPIGEYQFQIVQPPLRVILPDGAFTRLNPNDYKAYQDLLDHCINSLRVMLDGMLKWSKKFGILTFVFSFLTPQQNIFGRFAPVYDIRNPIYFINKLNEEMERFLADYDNAYIFDANQTMASLGKMHTQEDIVTVFNHGTFLGDYDFEHDSARIEPTVLMSEAYMSRVVPALKATWNELVAMYRSVRQIDMVKMVVIDLDDTLWRGVVADMDINNPPPSEGWPVGLWETLITLKNRGILLAIISKNEESRVGECWHELTRGHIWMDDFAMRKINWLPKSQNLAEIIEYVNILPRNILFIDDNSVQRAEVKAAYPDVRVLGGTPAFWRRILLWASETQFPSVTDESATRTAMVQAQVVREENRRVLTNDEFLATLDVKLRMLEISDVSHPRFARAFELINKTNQYNTTGQRWTHEECVAAFAQGVRLCAFDVMDKYTDYGLVGVLILDDAGIGQFVMSCRIMGLGIEKAAVATVANQFRANGAKSLSCGMIETDRNLPCREIYASLGATAIADGWQFDLAEPITVPPHIVML